MLRDASDAGERTGAGRRALDGVGDVLGVIGAAVDAVPVDPGLTPAASKRSTSGSTRSRSALA